MYKFDAMRRFFSLWNPLLLHGLFLWLSSILLHLIFWAYNARFFQVKFNDTIAFIPFDLSCITLMMLPIIALYFLPIPRQLNTLKQVLLKCIYTINLVVLLLSNIWDTAFFEYSQKRTGLDMYLYLLKSPEKNMIWLIIIDYWYFALLFLIWLLIGFYFYPFKEIFDSKKADLRQWFYVVIGLIIVFAIGRWSFGTKPLGVLDANAYTEPNEVPLILNSTFVLIKTIQSEEIRRQELISLKKSELYFNPVHQGSRIEGSQKGKNVVVILLESFGDKMIFKKENGIKITPFLDSLLSESLYYCNGMANGKQSIEALPAIFASLPNLTNTPYILSAFCNNKIVGLPAHLKKIGYSSAFFHGAYNGSMRFDSFSKRLGFENYYGKNEYPFPSHDDHHWGIPDAYFNPWCAKKISTLNPPFICALFTSSSHHPYAIPDQFKTTEMGKLSQINASFLFADNSLRAFFKQAKKTSWYQNTLFVICADHTPEQLDIKANDIKDKYRIPIAFFTPDESIKPSKNRKIIQQMDIMPAILNFLNYKKPYYSFGNALNKSPGEALNYLNGNYFLIQSEQTLSFNEEKVQFLLSRKSDINIVSFKNKSLYLNKSRLQLRLKSMIERYRSDLIRNKTSIK